MDFVGSIPKDCIEQALRVLDLANVRRAVICCSGTFRFERALTAKLPNIVVESNDVSLVDGRLAGGFIYTYSTGPAASADPRLQNWNTVYLLSDFSITGRRRLAKLICMLAAAHDAIHPVDVRRVQRTEWLLTTAFTDKPVSMKYHRGVGWFLVSRKPGHLNYASAVRQQPAQAIYQEWYRKHWAKGADAQDAA